MFINPKLFTPQLTLQPDHSRFRRVLPDAQATTNTLALLFNNNLQFSFVAVNKFSFYLTIDSVAIP